MKKNNSFSLLSAVVVSLLAPFCASIATAETICADYQGGTHNGFYYTHWSAGAGSACITLGNEGNYSYEWSGVTNHVGGKGWQPGSTDRIIGYNAGLFAPTGKAMLAVYGWTTDPLIEYYIVDNWGESRPSKGTSMGTIETDGGTYDLYRTQRVNKPSILGTQTFYQYWSVRTAKRALSTNHSVTFKNHAEAWAAKGWNLGEHSYQVVATEGLKDSAGKSNITVWEQGMSNVGGYTGAVNLPGRIEAENYNAAPVETSTGNSNTAVINQCTYYGLSVDVANASEGSCLVGWTSAGESLEYKVGAAGGSFDINIRLASRDANKRVSVYVNGTLARTVSSNGGGWEAWHSKAITKVTIPSNATIKVVFPDGGVNLNYLHITKSPTL